VAPKTSVTQALARRTGLPLVLDYRDEWGISNAYAENKRPNALSRWLQGRMQNHVVRAADMLLATTRSSARELEQVRARAQSAAEVAHIYNGYDPDDFAGRTGDGVQGQRKTYRLAYIGTLWELTSVAPLVEAVRGLAVAAPEAAERLELVFAGRRTAAQQTLLGHLTGLRCQVSERPYMEHAAALDLLHSADGLCVLLSDVPGAERVMPAKVFEYMATRRPIVAVAPKGEVWDVLADYPHKHLCLPSDAPAITRALLAEVQRKDGGVPPYFNGWHHERFSRSTQAGQLASILDGFAESQSERQANVPPS